MCQCVKALVYYDLQTCRLDLQNDKGDTALHMAARWGYEAILQVLLENGASTYILNKNKESALQCALNSKVSNTHSSEMERNCNKMLSRSCNELSVQCCA